VDPLALKRELWGWYLYDFANSAFFQSAGAVRDFLLQIPATVGSQKHNSRPQRSLVRGVVQFHSVQTPAVVAQLEPSRPYPTFCMHPTAIERSCSHF
jgi:hypothetical protein